MMLVQFSAGVSVGRIFKLSVWKFPFRLEICFSPRRRRRKKRERERERERAPAASDNVYKEEEALRTFAS